MTLQDVIELTAFETKIAVKKDGKIKHITYKDLKAAAPLLPLLDETVRCFYVENNELLIDLDDEVQELFKDINN